MGASSVTYPGKTEPETLEALACREAIALASDILAHRILMASDCRSVINTLETGTMGVYAQVVREIMEAKSSFDFMSFRHESREIGRAHV